MKKRTVDPAKERDYYTRLLRIQIEDHARAKGLTFPAALAELARTRPEIFNRYQAGK